MTNDKDSAVPDILERLQDEADLCRNDGADDIAQTLDDAINEIEALRQPTQSDALAPIGTEGKYVHDDLELSCRVTAHIEGWLEVEFLHNTDTPYYPVDRSSAIIRPSRFIPLQEQSPFAQSIPSLHIHLQKTQINRPSNLHKTQIAQT